MRAVSSSACWGTVSTLVLVYGAALAPQAVAQITGAPGGQHPPAAGGMDCEHLPSTATAIISVESCKKMMGAQQAYQNAASDPDASRPGDEQMSCAQISAELKAQSYTAPDQSTVAQGKAAASEEQATLARQEAKVAATVAAQSAAMSAASAADTATEVATAGVVHPNTASHLEQTFERQNRVMSDQMAAERRPTEQRLFNMTADVASTSGEQLTANPRLARLIQLAGAKHCKGG
jgi:hypothetical protein